MAYCGTVTVHDGDGEALHNIRYGTMPQGGPGGLCQSLAGDVLAMIAKKPRLRISMLCDGSPDMWNHLDAQFVSATRTAPFRGRVVARKLGGMRSTAKQWAERVRAWRESGQTATAFAAGKDFTEGTLRWWSTELERRARREAVPVARVVRTPSRESTTIVVTIGAARVEVRAGFDAALLRELVEALGEVQ